MVSESMLVILVLLVQVLQMRFQTCSRSPARAHTQKQGPVCNDLSGAISCELSQGIGLERNVSGLESEKLAVHSSRVSPARPRSRFTYPPLTLTFDLYALDVD